MTRQDRLARVKERYLRDGYERRLGGLATNLARVASFSDDSRHGQVVEDLIVESAYFIEWLAPDAVTPRRERLVQLQRELTGWHYRWGEIWQDETKRRGMAAAAQGFADEVLGMSGLLVTGGRS